MLFKSHVTPGDIITELVRNAQSQPGETEGFCHLDAGDLYAQFHAKAERIFAAVKKYSPISYDLRSAGDSGTNLIVRYMGNLISEGTERCISMQIVWPGALERDDDLLPVIRAQIEELEMDYDALLERYYLLVCANDKIYLQRKQCNLAELETDSTVVVVEPRYAWFFFTVEDAVIDATVDRLMYPEDDVRRQAKEQVSGIGKRKLILLLSCLVHAIEENGCFAVSDDFVMHNHIEKLGNNDVGDPGSLSDDVLAMEGRFFFREADVDGFEIYQESVAAIVALYYDEKVRYGHSGDEAVRYLYTLLEQSVGA